MTASARTRPAAYAIASTCPLSPTPSGEWVELALHETFSAATPNQFNNRISGFVSILAATLPGFRHTRKHFRTQHTSRETGGLFDQPGDRLHVHTLECSAEMKRLLDQILDRPLRHERRGF